MNESYVLGQRFAYATAALVIGIASFVNLLGMERAILAIIFAWLALKPTPEPPLKERRSWAWVGLVLGAVMLVLVPTTLVIFRDQVQALVEALEGLQ